MDAQSTGHAGEYKITFDTTSPTGPIESKTVGLGKICMSWKTKGLTTAKQKGSKYYSLQRYLLIAWSVCL